MLTFRKVVDCNASKPHGGERSILEAKGLYLMGDKLDERFFYGGIPLFPCVKSAKNYVGGVYWHYMYQNPQDDCKFHITVWFYVLM